MQSADFEICSTLERRQISADPPARRGLSLVSGSALRSATNYDAFFAHFRTNARNPLTMIGPQNSHVFLPHLNKSPQTPSLRLSWSLALRILMTRPHLSYFLPRMVLNPVYSPLRLLPPIPCQAPPGQQRRHPTTAALAKQATVLIR
jgi:hypothetical protein